MNHFFTSDTHFGHTNIIKYSSRPFADSEAMDETIIRNWNSVVARGDIVYHLGDFAYAPRERIEEILGRLNGSIHFIEGNHDASVRPLRAKFTSYRSLSDIKIGDQHITLCHYAMRVWNHSHQGAWHLYGHTHGSLPDDPQSRSFDVGVDCHHYTPLSFEQVAAIMAKKQGGLHLRPAAP